MRIYCQAARVAALVSVALSAVACQSPSDEGWEQSATDFIEAGCADGGPGIETSTAPASCESEQVTFTVIGFGAYDSSITVDLAGKLISGEFPFDDNNCRVLHATEAPIALTDAELAEVRAALEEITVGKKDVCPEPSDIMADGDHHVLDLGGVEFSTARRCQILDGTFTSFPVIEALFIARAPEVERILHSTGEAATPEQCSATPEPF